MKKLIMIIWMVLMIALVGCQNKEDLDSKVDQTKDNQVEDVTEDLSEDHVQEDVEDDNPVSDESPEAIDETEMTDDQGDEAVVEEEVPEEDVVDETETEDVVFIEEVYKIGIPYIAYVDSGYGVVKDGQALTDMDYDYMTYIQASEYVQAQKDGLYCLVSLADMSVSELVTEAEFKGLVSQVVYDSELEPFQDEVTGLWGYSQDGEVILEASYSEVGYFMDGYAVVFDSSLYVYQLIDEDMKVLVTSDAEIRNLGYGVVGVADDMLYMAGFEPYRLMDMNNGGAFISDDYYFEADMVTDNMILVSDHLERWLIDRFGNPIDTEFSELPSAYLAFANIIGNKMYFCKDIGFEIGDIVICDIEGHHLMNSFEMNPSGLESLGDDVYVEIHPYMKERFTDVRLPQLSLSGDYSRFEAVNDEIRMIFGVDDYEPLPMEDVWNVYEVDFVVNRIGDIANIVLSEYWYGFGAAHGNYGDYSINVDINTGQTYILDDLFVDVDAGYAELNNLVSEQKAENPEYYFEGEEVIIDGEAKFNVVDDGINLYFNPYEIGPYAAGILVFEISLDDLDDVLDFESPLVQNIIGK